MPRADLGSTNVAKKAVQSCTLGERVSKSAKVMHIQSQAQSILTELRYVSGCNPNSMLSVQYAYLHTYRYSYVYVTCVMRICACIQIWLPQHPKSLPCPKWPKRPSLPLAPYAASITQTENTIVALMAALGLANAVTLVTRIFFTAGLMAPVLA